MGAVGDLIREIPKIKVYATKFTKFILINEGIDPNQITEIAAHKKLNFGGGVSIFPISVSHSVPDAVMYVINTKDGAVVYTGDFIIDPSMSDAYHMDLGKIAYVGKQGVLALLSESVFSEIGGHTSPNHKLTSFFKDIINKTTDRMIFTVLPFHLYTIEEIFNAAKNSHRKIVIMGKKLQNVVNMAIENKYLKINPNIIGDLSHIDNSNTILLVCDDKEHPYSAIDKIVSGYDKFIKLKKEDTVVFAEPKYDENEKILVRIENEIAKMGANIISIPKDKEILQHASSQDLMLMIDLLQPKYYMPVKGDYRYMVNNADLATTLGMKPENIILKQNGEVVTIKDGKLIETTETIAVNEILIDGNSNDDVGELVIKDREMLSENGIVLISATLSKQDKVLLVGPEVTTRGFIYIKDSIEITKSKFINEVLPQIKNIRDSALVSCFSKISNSILMWGHYGDKHAGICIGFEKPENDFYDLIYSKKRTKFPLYDLACIISSYILTDENPNINDKNIK